MLAGAMQRIALRRSVGSVSSRSTVVSGCVASDDFEAELFSEARQRDLALSGAQIKRDDKVTLDAKGKGVIRPHLVV